MTHQEFDSLLETIVLGEVARFANEFKDNPTNLSGMEAYRFLLLQSFEASARMTAQILEASNLLQFDD